MQFPFFMKKKSHLEYTSISGWLHGESVPQKFALEYGSGRRPDYKVYMTQFCELREHLFERHIKTLPEEIQKQLESGQHPSQSQANIGQAEPVLKRLKDILSGLDFVEDVSIKRAQMNLAQFNVIVKDEPTLQQSEMIPEYFEGYVINTVWRRKDG